ncbi:unnamed protein product, partial [Trichogramma brassicae]
VRNRRKGDHSKVVKNNQLIYRRKFHRTIRRDRIFRKFRCALHFAHAVLRCKLQKLVRARAAVGRARLYGRHDLQRRATTSDDDDHIRNFSPFLIITWATSQSDYIREILNGKPTLAVHAAIRQYSRAISLSIFRGHLIARASRGQNSGGARRLRGNSSVRAPRAETLDVSWKNTFFFSSRSKVNRKNRSKPCMKSKSFPMRLTTTTSERRSETKRPPFSFSLRYKHCKRRTARNPVTIRDVARVIKIPLARASTRSSAPLKIARRTTSRKLSELNITYPWICGGARPCWRPQRQRRLRRLSKGFAAIVYCIYMMLEQLENSVQARRRRREENSSGKEIALHVVRTNATDAGGSQHRSPSNRCKRGGSHTAVRERDRERASFALLRALPLIHIRELRRRRRMRRRYVHAVESKSFCGFSRKRRDICWRASFVCTRQCSENYLDTLNNCSSDRLVRQSALIICIEICLG